MVDPLSFREISVCTLSLVLSPSSLALSLDPEWEDDRGHHHVDDDSPPPPHLLFPSYPAERSLCFSPPLRKFISSHLCRKDWQWGVQGKQSCIHPQLLYCLFPAVTVSQWRCLAPLLRPGCFIQLPVGFWHGWLLMNVSILTLDGFIELCKYHSEGEKVWRALLLVNRHCGSVL